MTTRLNFFSPVLLPSTYQQQPKINKKNSKRYLDFACKYAYLFFTLDIKQ